MHEVIVGPRGSRFRDRLSHQRSRHVIQCLMFELATYLAISCVQMRDDASGSIIISIWAKFVMANSALPLEHIR